MTIYAGLDVSDKTTHICVVDGDGAVVRRDVVASDPEVLARWLTRHCPALARVVLETGAQSTFLYHGLIEREVPVTCICARHAKKALSARTVTGTHSYGDTILIARRHSTSNYYCVPGTWRPRNLSLDVFRENPPSLD